MTPERRRRVNDLMRSLQAPPIPEPAECHKFDHRGYVSFNDVTCAVVCSNCEMRFMPMDRVMKLCQEYEAEIDSLSRT